MTDIRYKYEVTSEDGKVLSIKTRPKYFSKVSEDNTFSLCNNEEEAIGIIIKKKPYSIKGKAQVKDYPFVTITVIEKQISQEKKETV